MLSSEIWFGEGVREIALFSQAPSSEAGSCPAHAVQILSLQCNQDRHKSCHPANVLQIGKSVWLYIWITNDFFSFGAEAEVAGAGAVSVHSWCCGAGSD